MGDTAMLRRATVQLVHIGEHAFFMGLTQQRQVPLDEAAVDWCARYGGEFARWYREHVDYVNGFCTPRCGDTCRGPKDCPYMTIETVHELLDNHPGGREDYRERHGIPVDAPVPCIPQ